MTEKHVTKDELMRMFLEANMDALLGQSFVEAFEKRIPSMPKEQQNEMQHRVNKLKENPQQILAGQKRNVPAISKDIDRKAILESEEFKKFEAACEPLIASFEENYDEVEDSFKQSYLEMGVTLIVD